MKFLIIKKTAKKGKGLFANRDFKKGELIAKHDINRLKKYTLEEVRKAKISKELKEHWDYFGNEKYVLDDSPFSYSNHSCEPNTYTVMKSITKLEHRALRDIKKGEELTHDYSLTTVDQFDQKPKKKGVKYWEMKCKCGAKNCRKIITGDFFQLPKLTQKKFYKYLPPSIKRKYKDNFKRIRDERK